MLGSYLEKLGYYFLPETAGLLISGGLTAGERADSTFDKKVMSLEFARDNCYCSSNRKVQIVETWHPGNIAYAMARSSPIVCAYKNRFLRSLQKFDVKCLILDVSPRTSCLRSLKLQKPTINSHSFLVKVKKFTTIVIEEFELVSVTIDSTKSSEFVTHKALEILQSWFSKSE